MKALYGFGKPYDFHKILPFLAGLFLLLTILAAAGGQFAATGHLKWGALREAYFLYLVGLSLAGTLLSIFPRIAWLVLAICFTELLIGVGSYALAAIHVLPAPLFPAAAAATPNVGQFQYHPLLQVIPTPNYSRLHPFAISHDSNGIRGPERTSTELKQQVVIATVGSSTTYDPAVPNGQTWSDDLERQLGRGYAVINHGVPGYSSVENLLQTLFYLDTYGVRPHCAVYFGWNDITNAHLPNLDPAYANFHLLSQVEFVRRKLLEVSFSPLARIVNRSLEAAFDPVPFAPNFLKDPPVPGTDVRLEQIFRRNLEAIAAINRERQIISVFVGQVWNRAQLQSKERYGFFPLVRDVDVWPLQDHFNAILKETADSIGVSNFIPPIDEFQDDDFADTNHFSIKGASKFALMITPIVKSLCKNDRSGSHN
jgi:lysophospholipase L1-like esterase